MVIGRGAYIGPDVPVGDNCKIQNHALVYEPAVLEPGVFIGPAVVLTNDHYPRAVNADGTPKSAHDWIPVGVTLREGASVGARSVCVAPVTVGRWALVAAGSVVNKDVPDFALVAGGPRPAPRAGSARPASRWRTAATDCWSVPKTDPSTLEIDGVLKEKAA